MKVLKSVLFFLLLVLVLVVVILGPDRSMVQIPVLAQQVGIVESAIQETNTSSVYISPTISYQGRLVDNGMPVTGSRSMTFNLYDHDSGGTPIWTEGPKSVSVSNGLFTVTLGDTTALVVDNFAQQLYLEINVAGTVLPRQLLQGAPYALSLAPGADVNGSTSDSMLYVNNNSSSGIALSATVASTNTTAILTNNGTGALLKGFGSGGGNDEFNFQNDGTFQDKAASYIFIPGAFANSYGNPVVISPWNTKAVIKANPIGEYAISLPVILPAVLYGQNVKVEQISIYYSTDNSASYISQTIVYRVNAYMTGGSPFINDATDYNSTSQASYDEAPNNLFLNSTDDTLLFLWNLNFTNTAHNIYLFGVRLKLRHHPLY